MRKAYSSILLFYLILHFIIPIIYYYFNGFVNLYSEIEYNIYVFKGIMLNVITVLGTIFVIRFLPDNKNPILPKFSNAYIYLVFTIIILLISIKLSGGYEGAVGGSLNGTFISYILLFFDVSVGIAMFLFFQKNIKYAGLAIILYILLLTFSGSRSAIIIIVIISLIIPMFRNGVIIRKKLRRLIIVLSLFSPLLFFYGSSIRGDVDSTIVYNLIVGRISMAELASIPVEAKDLGTMNTAIYDAKYGLSNQFQQAVNEISPINPFKQDINPNQFHRAVFKGVSEETIFTKYMSVNLTLPTYFYLETNFFFACFLSILFLSLLYYVWVRYSSNIYLLVGIILNLYYILQYFDWVLIISSFYRMFLSIFALVMLNKAIQMFKKKKNDKVIIANG